MVVHTLRLRRVLDPYSTLARAALTQQAGYLEVLSRTSPWNPSDLVIHMTRRVRGLPLWFSLASNGTKAYEHAVERGRPRYARRPTVSPRHLTSSW